MSFSEKTLRALGLVRGNWFGPGYMGGVYGGEIPDLNTLRNPPADVYGQPDPDDVVAKFHDLALFLVKCADVPRAVAVAHHEAADLVLSRWLGRKGWFAVAATAFLAGGLTGVSLRRSDRFRPLTPAEQEVVLEQYPLSVAALRRVYPAGAALVPDLSGLTAA